MPVYSVEAPVGGWNARDALDNIPASDAFDFFNLVAERGYVRSRGGSTEVEGFANGASDYHNIGTLMPFSATGDNQLLAAVKGTIYRILPSTTALAADDTYLVGTVSSNFWNYAQTHGRLIMADGYNSPLEYDGTTLSAISGIGGVGLTVSDLIGVMPFKGRVFYWERGGTSFWYPGAGEYKNASMSEYEMNQFITKGGQIALGFTWTLDSGSGVDDLAVFVFSTGETLIYQGSDPGSASDWALIGRFEIGQPLGAKAYCHIGGDVLIATKDGIESISSVFKGKGLTDRITDKISGAYRKAVEQFASNADIFTDTRFDSWGLFYAPSISSVILTLPSTSNGRGKEGSNVVNAAANLQQYVYRVDTQTWSRWLVDHGMGAICELDGSLYFSINAGTDAYVAVYDDTVSADLDGTAVDEYNFDCKATQMISLAGPGERFQLTGVCPLTTHQEPDQIYIDTASDYQEPAYTVLSPTETDNAASETVTRSWRILAEEGHSVTLLTAWREAGGTVKWYATQMTYKGGGPL